MIKGSGALSEIRATIIAILGRTFSTTVAVYLFMDGKIRSGHPVQHALIGSAIRLIVGVTFVIVKAASWTDAGAVDPFVALAAGRSPANVSLSDLAIVTAGLAKDVDAVNQYAAVM